MVAPPVPTPDPRPLACILTRPASSLISSSLGPRILCLSRLMLYPVTKQRFSKNSEEVTKLTADTVQGDSPVDVQDAVWGSCPAVCV